MNLMRPCVGEVEKPAKSTPPVAAGQLFESVAALHLSRNLASLVHAVVGITN
jgi:hypothetical protein